MEEYVDAEVFFFSSCHEQSSACILRESVVPRRQESTVHFNV